MANIYDTSYAAYEASGSKRSYAKWKYDKEYNQMRREYGWKESKTSLGLIKPKQSYTSKYTKELSSLREKLKRRSANQAKMADIVFSEQAESYEENAQALSVMAKSLYGKNFKTESALKSALEKAQDMVSRFSFYKSNSDLYHQETLAQEQFKKASKELMVATYYKGIWGEGMTNEERDAAIRKEVTDNTGIPNPSTRQILDYYEEVINKDISRRYGVDDIGYHFPFVDGMGEDIFYYEEAPSVYYVNGSPVRINLEYVYAPHLG